MNNNADQSGLPRRAFAIFIIIFLTIVYFCGCTDTQNTDNNLNNFIGTWAGSLEVSTSGGPMIDNSTFTKFTFMEDVVVATLTNDQATNTMNYTYVVNGNNLVLEPLFFGSRMMPGSQMNDTRPPFNGTGFPDYNPPLNGTKPPFNYTEPFNNTWAPNYTRPPSGQQSPSMSLSFLCSFDENYTVLYLDGSKFIKIQ